MYISNSCFQEERRVDGCQEEEHMQMSIRLIDAWENIELKLAALVFISILYLISRKEAKAIDFLYPCNKVVLHL